MNYKIISENKNIINKAKNAFNVLNMNESIHIQDVNFYLIDVNALNKNSLLSYKNKNKFTSMLFIVNSDEDINLCLQNSFTNYIKSTFSSRELISWCKYFFNKKVDNILRINENTIIDFDNKNVNINKNKISLSKRELLLLQKLDVKKYTNTNTLMNELNLKSTTSIRTIINRIRNKTYKDLILQKKDFGYKLNAQEYSKKKEIKINEAKVNELKEQNLLLQEIVDSSNSFIVTFIHEELYCINKSFREYLGSDTISQLWNNDNSDFFHLFKSTNITIKEEKEKLLKKGIHKVKMYNYTSKSTINFEVKTIYFENIDKHLLVFRKI